MCALCNIIHCSDSYSKPPASSSNDAAWSILQRLTMASNCLSFSLLFSCSVFVDNPMGIKTCLAICSSSKIKGKHVLSLLQSTLQYLLSHPVTRTTHSCDEGCDRAFFPPCIDEAPGRTSSHICRTSDPASCLSSTTHVPTIIPSHCHSVKKRSVIGFCWIFRNDGGR